VVSCVIGQGIGAGQLDEQFGGRLLQLTTLQLQH
jgi:hypothetical protein